VSNVAGKAYAMNVVTPLPGYCTPLCRLIFWLVRSRLFHKRLRGLRALSLIHFARWVVLRDDDFPVLSDEQPSEHLKYTYVLFFSSFNGSWAQYLDSFSAAIPRGLNLLWYRSVKYPGARSRGSLHAYVTANQLQTSHYYSAYPLASASDVKAALRVKRRLCEFIDEVREVQPEEFRVCYQRMLLELQNDLAPLEPAPPMSLTPPAVELVGAHAAPAAGT
jgi:hypothetical protein